MNACIQEDAANNSAIKSLKERGYKIKALKKIGGGINSKLYKVMMEDGDLYALKIYKEKTNEDKRDRALTEISFYQYLNEIDNPEIKISEVANYSLEQRWSLIRWIAGKQIKSVTAKNIDQIVKFISAINTKKDHIKELDYASEACTSHGFILRNAIDRLELIKDRSSKISADIVYTWVKKTLEPEIVNRIKRFTETRVKEAWNDDGIGNIVSPSDVGIHNAIGCGDELYFIDFEYAGKDDLSKLANDWVLQPNYPLGKEQEIRLLKGLAEIFPNKNDLWMERYIDLKPMLQVKWCMIMVNACIKHEEKEDVESQLNLIKNYYDKVANANEL